MTRLLSAFAVCCAALPLYTAAAERTYDTDILADTFGFDESTPKSVALEDLHQGCPARDCIPSIDDPKYVAADAASHVADDDPVIAIALNGDHRAYPARIMDRHEFHRLVNFGNCILNGVCPFGAADHNIHPHHGQVGPKPGHKVFLVLCGDHDDQLFDIRSFQKQLCRI